MDEFMNELYEENLNQIFKSNTDPDGSYTGTSTDEDFPEATQDVDDL